jgi:hypothetical protein
LPNVSKVMFLLGLTPKIRYFVLPMFEGKACWKRQVILFIRKKCSYWAKYYMVMGSSCCAGVLASLHFWKRFMHAINNSSAGWCPFDGSSVFASAQADNLINWRGRSSQKCVSGH